MGFRDTENCLANAQICGYKISAKGGQVGERLVSLCEFYRVGMMVNVKK